MKSQLPQVLDLTPNMSNDAAIRQGYSQQRQGKGRPLLGENERAPLRGQALVSDQPNMRSVESEAAERAQGQGDNFTRGSAQAVPAVRQTTKAVCRFATEWFTRW